MVQSRRRHLYEQGNNNKQRVWKRRKDYRKKSRFKAFVRWTFGKLFAKDIAARNKNVSVERPKDETEAIADIFKRMDEIQERLEHERRQRKKLEERINQ